MYNPEINYVNNAIDNLRGGGAKDLYTTKGILGRLNYGLDDTYFANVAYRRDASSRFAPENRWGNFWSASAAWILTNEPFLAGNPMINMLKLKASYGEQGNDNIGNYYAWLDQYRVTGAEGVFSDGTLIYKGNPDLTWETSTSYNVGFDFALFRHALSGSVEYFGRKSVDMLYNKPVAGSLGYTSIPLNVGSMTNSGIEVDLGWNIVNTNHVQWTLNANATAIKNKINELHPDLDGELIDGTRVYSEGESMYRMYLVDYAGVDSETGVAQYWAKDENQSSTNLNQVQADYIAGLGYVPYTQVKFAAYNDKEGTSTNANDIPLMRIEEMYLIKAEAEAMGGGDGKGTLESFIKEYRDTSYVVSVSAPQDVQEEVFRQRRIELWGEGLNWFDIMRLNKGVDRRGGDFPNATMIFDIKAGSDLLLWRIPEAEIQANPAMSEGDNNPSAPSPDPVPDE